MPDDQPVTLSKLAMMKSRFAQFSSHGIVRATSILVGGTVLGNLVTAASMPVVTRLYTPDQMSVLAVFGSILQTLYVSVCPARRSPVA